MSNENPTVEPYQKTASLGGWAGAGRTLWAIGALGTIAGAAIGAVAPLFPAMTSAITLSEVISSGAILNSTAAFASIGMAMGFSGGLMLGRISGSNAAVAEEQEKRLKTWITTQLKQLNPTFQTVETQSETNQTAEEKANITDTYRTYINPRIGMMMAAVGAVAGLILSAGFLLTEGAAGSVFPKEAFQVLTGLDVAASEASKAAIIAYTTGITASFGALFSFNFPKLTSAMTEFAGKLIGGEIIGREWGPEKQPELQLSQPSRATDLPPTHVLIRQSQRSTQSFTEQLARPQDNYQQRLQSQQSDHINHLGV